MLNHSIVHTLRIAFLRHRKEQKPKQGCFLKTITEGSFAGQCPSFLIIRYEECRKRKTASTSLENKTSSTNFRVFPVSLPQSAGRKPEFFLTASARTGRLKSEDGSRVPRKSLLFFTLTIIFLVFHIKYLSQAQRPKTRGQLFFLV